MITLPPNFNKLISFCDGSKFSSGEVFHFAGDAGPVVLRDFLRTLVTGKKVLHIGACDHISLIDSKVKTDSLIHNYLTSITSLCYGIDINEEAINLLKLYGIDNIFNLDITRGILPNIIKNNDWDYLLLLDVLEHIPNPIFFLENVKQRLSKNSSKIIITVPNAFFIGNFFLTFLSKECINTDHYFWFTPYTLAKVCVKAGLNPLKFFFLQRNGLPSRRFFIKRTIINQFHLFRDTLALECDF